MASTSLLTELIQGLGVDLPSTSRLSLITFHTTSSGTTWSAPAKHISKQEVSTYLQVKHPVRAFGSSFLRLLRWPMVAILLQDLLISWLRLIFKCRRHTCVEIYSQLAASICEISTPESVLALRKIDGGGYLVGGCNFRSRLFQGPDTLRSSRGQTYRLASDLSYKYQSPAELVYARLSRGI